MPSSEDVEILINPPEATRDSLLDKAAGERVHIFSGIGAYETAERATLIAAERDLNFGILTEPARWDGCRAPARFLKGFIRTCAFRSRIDFLLPVGHLAEDWLKIIGFPAEMAFPWGYFPGRDAGNNTKANENDEHEFMFIGQLCRRKGVDVLLDAISNLPGNQAWRLTYIGDGPWRNFLKERAKELGIRNRVDFTGALPNKDAMKLLQGADTLVLPSRWDGWGAVTNEAILRGVPTICSDRCGSASIVRSAPHCDEFESHSSQHLREKLQLRLKEHDPISHADVQNWSTNISPKSASRYLDKVIRYAYAPSEVERKPMPPWHMSSSSFSSSVT